MNNDILISTRSIKEVFPNDIGAIDAIKYLVQKKLLKATSTQKLKTESFNYPIRGNVKLYLASNVEKAISNFKGGQFQSIKELEIKFARLLEAIKLLREKEINAAS